MVKNTKGGNKSKAMARKFSVDSQQVQRHIRLPEGSLEHLAVCTKMFGQMCEVILIDQRVLRCHIRGKFRGRSKRHAFVVVGSLLLVGMRDFLSADSLVCDLLEVYDHTEVTTMTTMPSLNIQSLLALSPSLNKTDQVSDMDVVFSNEEPSSSSSCTVVTSRPTTTTTCNDEIDFDMI